MEDISLHILDIVQNSVQAKAKNIGISLVIKKEWLTLRIEDDGEGMSKETVKNCFDPFFSTKGKKTGLGIPLLFQSCRQTGGNLIIKSKIGKGTRISAKFNLSHIDCKPLGKIAETLKVLQGANPEINFSYEEKL